MSRRGPTWLAYRYGTEPTGEVLVQDVWFFDPTNVRSVQRFWEQTQRWVGEWGADPAFATYVTPKPPNWIPEEWTEPPL